MSSTGFSTGTTDRTCTPPTSGSSASLRACSAEAHGRAYLSSSRNEMLFGTLVTGSGDSSSM